MTHSVALEFSSDESNSDEPETNTRIYTNAGTPIRAHSSPEQDPSYNSYAPFQHVTDYRLARFFNATKISQLKIDQTHVTNTPDRITTPTSSTHEAMVISEEPGFPYHPFRSCDMKGDIPDMGDAAEKFVSNTICPPPDINPNIMQLRKARDNVKARLVHRTKVDITELYGLDKLERRSEINDRIDFLLEKNRYFCKYQDVAHSLTRGRVQ